MHHTLEMLSVGRSRKPWRALGRKKRSFSSFPTFLSSSEKNLQARKVRCQERFQYKAQTSTYSVWVRACSELATPTGSPATARLIGGVKSRISVMGLTFSWRWYLALPPCCVGFSEALWQDGASQSYKLERSWQWGWRQLTVSRWPKWFWLGTLAKCSHDTFLSHSSATVSFWEHCTGHFLDAI